MSFQLFALEAGFMCDESRSSSDWSNSKMGKSTTVQTADDDLETLRIRYIAQRNEFALSVSALARKVFAGEIDP